MKKKNLLLISVIIIVIILIILLGSKDNNVIDNENPFLGNENASVVIIEYSDFQCPVCAAAYPIVKQIKENCLKDEKIIELCNLYTTEVTSLNRISKLKDYNDKKKEIKAKIDNLGKEREKLYNIQKKDFTKKKQQLGLVPAILDFFEKEMPNEVIIDLLTSYLKELKK